MLSRHPAYTQQQLGLDSEATKNRRTKESEPKSIHLALRLDRVLLRRLRKLGRAETAKSTQRLSGDGTLPTF